MLNDERRSELPSHANAQPQTVELRAPTGRLDRAIDLFLLHAGPLRIQNALIGAIFRRAGLEEQFFSLRNGRVHAWVAPARERETRPPLLLLHGFGADAQLQWFRQVGPLSLRYRLIIPDLLFFGRSEAARPDPHLNYQVETLLDLLDLLGIERTHLLGISYGGLCAMEMASSFDERVERLIVSNSPGPIMTPADHAALIDRLKVSEIADLLVPRDATEMDRLLRVAWHRPPPIPSFAKRDAFNRYFRDRVDERRAITRALIARIGEPGLLDRRIAHDSLILWGEHDPVFPVEMAHRLKAFIGKRAALQVFRRTAHAPNQERPRDYNRAVLGFLSER